MNKYREIVGRINYWLFGAVVVLLPFPQIFLRYATVLWLVSWLLEGRWLSKPQSLRENKMAIPFILFGLWYVWRIVSGLWADDLAAWSWQMERYLTFGLIVPIGIWGVNKYYDWRQLGKALTISCVAAIPFYLIVMTVLYYHREIIDQLNWVADWNYGVRNWNSFFINNISVLKHRLFLCSVEILGALMALLVWKEKRWFQVLLILTMLASIPMTGSRQSILTIAAMIVAGVIYLLPQQYRLRYGIGILLIGILAGGAVLRFHPRMQGFDIRAVTEMRTISPDHDVRFNIWGVALQQPTDYIRYGLGAGQSTNYMLARYQETGCDYYYEKQYNTHNQYLEETMEIGLFGMLFFVLAWLVIPFCAQKKGRFIAILFVLLYLLNMFTDCMFGRFDGIILWAVYMLLIYQTSREDTVACDRPTPA